MNGSRRSELRDALKILSGVVVIIDGVCEKEQDALDNCPDNLRDSARCEAMEIAIENLTEAVEKIDEAKACLETAIA